MVPPPNTAPKRMRGPAVVLGCTALITVGSIYYSHYAQVRDKRIMKEGVQRDKERIKWKQTTTTETRKISIARPKPIQPNQSIIIVRYMNVLFQSYGRATFSNAR